jgi:hypothetical protein
VGTYTIENFSFRMIGKHFITACGNLAERFLNSCFSENPNARIVQAELCQMAQNILP